MPQTSARVLAGLRKNLSGGTPRVVIGNLHHTMQGCPSSVFKREVAELINPSLSGPPHPNPDRAAFKGRHATFILQRQYGGIGSELKVALCSERAAPAILETVIEDAVWAAAHYMGSRWVDVQTFRDAALEQVMQKKGIPSDNVLDDDYAGNSGAMWDYGDFATSSTTVTDSYTLPVPEKINGSRAVRRLGLLTADA